MAVIPYCGPAPAPSAILSAWNFDPLLLAVLVLAGFALRARPLRVQIGMAMLWIAFVSPLCALSAGLFSARSVHHLLIVFAAAPLLAGALPRSLRLPPLWAITLAHVAVFWAWHVPAAYGWALSSDAAYWAGQVALLGSAMAFWAVLTRPATPAPMGFLALLAMVMQMGLLGALITFAPRALYAPHFLTTGQYGLSPLEDQQLAGLLMWVGSLPLAAAAGWAVLRRLMPAAPATPPVGQAAA